MRKTLVAGLALSLLSSTAIAQVLSTPTDATTSAAAANSTSRYWTSVRMQSARAPDKRVSNDPSPNPSAASTSSAADGLVVPGGPPEVPSNELPPGVQKGSLIEQNPSTEEVPAATSSYGAFTTAQTIQNESSVYPWLMAGKLFFTEQGVGDFVCSASVIRLGLVLTAGHCVYQPKTATQTAHFYTNFMFVPGLYKTFEPVGEWFPIQEGTTGEWASGGDTVPNAQDVGMMAMAESPGGKLIGQVTGYFGYRTQGLAGNHVTMLGYPCNLDNCTIMERTDTGASTSGDNNTEIYPSAAAGGASGGPWVQDFGLAPTNTGNTAWPLGLDYVVGVTSYQPSSGGGGYLGSSILDSSFTGLLAALCSLHSGYC